MSKKNFGGYEKGHNVNKRNVPSVSISFIHIVSNLPGYVEVTEWQNGEGCHITISASGNENLHEDVTFDLPWESLAALSHAIEKMF